MFDYESAAGQAFIKDKHQRLISQEWTDTGIRLTIGNIDKTNDLGKYKGEVEIGQEHKSATIEINQIIGKSFLTL